MNTYACFWRSCKVEITAITAFAARKIAIHELQKLAPYKKVKQKEINIRLTSELKK